MSKLRQIALEIAKNPNKARNTYRIASFIQTPGKGKMRKERQKPVPIQRVVSLKLRIREEIVKEAQAPPPSWALSVANDHAAVLNREAA